MLRPLAAALLLTLAPAAYADDLQNRLVAGARATDTSGYAFTERLTANGNGPGIKPVALVTAYDPRRAPADRWRRISVDGNPPTPKQIEQARKNRREAPTYADLAKWLGSPATRADGAEGSVTYRFARLPAGTVKLGKYDASANTAAEVVVAGAGGPAPYVREVRFGLTKAFRMMLVASVKTMNTAVRFRRLPDGALVTADVQNTLAGSMMGKSGDIRTSVSYADWQKVR